MSSVKRFCVLFMGEILRSPEQVVNPMKVPHFSLFMLLPMLLLLALTGSCNRAEISDPVIRRGNIEAPRTLDPALADSVHEFNILIDLYEGLVGEDAAGRLIAGVASDWTISEDGLHYTFALRHDARWSDGSRVTAEDFVRALRRVADPETNSAYASLLAPIAGFAAIQRRDSPPALLGVTAPDEATLAIELTQPTPYVLRLLSLPIAFPRHRESTDGEPSEAVITNGPYTLVSRHAGDSLRLERNRWYWDAGSVETAAIEYVAVAEEVTEMQMYLAGELDITGSIAPAHLARLTESRPDEVRTAPMLALYYLAFDLTEPPLEQTALRAALSMAIDREQIVALLGRGEIPAYAIVPPGTANHQAVRYDWQASDAAERVREAQALLEQAGFGPDNPLELTLTYDVGSIHEKVALAVSDQWQRLAGVEITLDKREWQYFLATREQRDEWQVMRFSWFGDYNDPTTFTDIFHSDSPQNLPRYHNDRYDTLLARAATTEDIDRRSALLAEAEQMLLNDYPIAPLYFFASKHLVRPDIAGFEDNVLDRHPSRYLSRRPEARR